MVLFSYTVLFDQNFLLKEKATTVEDAFNSSLNETNTTLRVSVLSNAQFEIKIKIPILEIILFFWIVGFIIEERKQVVLMAFYQQKES